MKLGYYAQILYCLLGYLVQYNLAFFDTYKIVDGRLEINYTLSVLKILMIFETLKRIYFYIIGIFLLIDIETSKSDRCMYVMSFEIVYAYFWFNFYSNFTSGGYYLNKCYNIIGITFSLIYGLLAFGCYFYPVKIILGVFNLIFILAHVYSIYWRYRENY